MLGEAVHIEVVGHALVKLHERHQELDHLQDALDVAGALCLRQRRDVFDVDVAFTQHRRCGSECLLTREDGKAATDQRLEQLGLQAAQNRPKQTHLLFRSLHDFRRGHLRTLPQYELINVERRADCLAALFKLHLTQRIVGADVERLDAIACT